MKRTLFISAVALGLGLASCDSYLDINTSPNSPSAENITTSILMPAIEMNMASSYGNYLRITGGFYAQYYAHRNGTSNYVDYSQFTMSPTRSSGTYTQFTQKALNNLSIVLEKAKAEADHGTFLAATVLRGFIFQTLVDCYGEIPYSEAFNPEIMMPKYDDGKTIYEGVLKEIDAALAEAEAGDVICTNFLFPSAKADKWIQFANALKLKMLMRMANVQDVKSQVATLIQENNFPTEDISYKDCWANESGQMNPFFSEEFSPAWGSAQRNIAANLAILQSMDGDPRLPKFFNANKAGKYVGGISGTQYPSTASLNDWCDPVNSYDMPVYLITVSEIEFFKAEYEARYGSATNAATHYARAIEASFATAGADGAAAYIAQHPYNQANYKKSLGEAKWVALSGVNPFEGYCEVRRLDYPAFGQLEGSDFYSEGDDDSFDTSAYVPFTLYTPIKVFGQVGSNKLLERFPYPESSTARNENAPDFPGYTTPIFWGK